MPTARHPNILFVMADQWPGALIGCAGHPAIRTPTLDWLASIGIRYPNAYSESPGCIQARRTIMTGCSPRRHGLRSYEEGVPMPELPLLAQAFGDAGYQAYAVGKLHVHPPRSRIGFDDVTLVEEGRAALGGPDDYDLFLADQGFAGQQFLHGMGNNDYLHRPWHLPEHCHVTAWITREACRQIKRRDPTRPALWYVSYTHPHPPLAPLRDYLELYRDAAVPAAASGPWAESDEALPPAVFRIRQAWARLSPEDGVRARRAFYALCTHIDHQLRVLIGTLREERLLDETAMVFTSDHGDLLGDFGLWGKRLFYEGSARVPMLVAPPASDPRLRQGVADPRLVGLQDVMPTLLDLAGLPVPDSVEGLSMLGPRGRPMLYGECREDLGATRMVHDGTNKLIWYPAGNRVQLFDLARDPAEREDLGSDPGYRPIREALERFLVGQLYGGDERWARDGQLVGFDAPSRAKRPDRTLGGQRGLQFPPPLT